MKEWRLGREQVLLEEPGFRVSRVRMEKEEACHMTCDLEQAARFLLVKEGVAVCQINHKHIEVREKDGLFINVGAAFRLTGIAGQACEFVFVSYAPETERQSREALFLQPVLEAKELSWYYLEKTKDFRALLDAMEFCEEKSDEEKKIFLTGVLFCLLGEIYGKSREKRENPDKTEQKEQEKLKKMLEFLHAHYKEHMTLEQMAEASKVSKGEYCRFFKRQMAQTPVEYLQQYRIEKSLPLLTEKKKTMGDIASQCGFHGSSYYAEIFKKEMGCSPGDYRKWRLSGGECPLREDSKIPGKAREEIKKRQESIPLHLL